MVSNWFRTRAGQRRWWRADKAAGGMVEEVERRLDPRGDLRSSSPQERRPRQLGSAHQISLQIPGQARRLLFINQYYWPDHASTAQHLTDLAESLAEQGHEVHVLCAQGRYRGPADRPPALRGAQRGADPPRPRHVAGPARARSAG